MPRVLKLNGQRRLMLKVFEPAEARRRFAALHGSDPPFVSDAGVEEGPEQLLSSMAHDTLSGLRPLTVADRSVIEGLSALRAEMPNFSNFLSLLEISAHASAQAQVPFSIVPTILLGSPGVGKTRLCRRLSEVLRVTCEELSMPSLSGAMPLSGTDATWKTSKPGLIAETLVKSAYANPMIVLDELDKCHILHEFDAPLDILHSLWEREGATRFRDDCTKLRFDASAIFWLATANELDELRPSLIDRAQIFEIQPPTADQMAVIVSTAYRELCERWLGWFSPELNPSVIDHLRSASPRLVHRTLELAMKLCAAHGRREIAIDDAISAITAMSVEDKPRVGFIR